MTPHRGTQVRPEQQGPLNLAGTLRSPIKVIAIQGALGNGADLLRYHGKAYITGSHFEVDPFDLPELLKKRQVQVVDDLPVPHWWDAPGRVLQCEPGFGKVWSEQPTPGALKIAQGTGYDPGNAAYRFHSAVNEYSKHCSAFIRWITTNNNPFHCPTQYNATTDPEMARALALDADVLHCHVDWILPRNLGLGVKARPNQLLIRHYHGTQFNPQGKQMPHHEQVPIVFAEADDVVGATLVGARLTLCALRPGRMHWLPITVPVARYAAMAASREPYRKGRPFRIAHSPTKSSIKGTSVLIQVLKKLKQQGLNVEPVMIERKHHAAALALKATADACFDSFALGIQGSGLEAAAMGQPVIAGDDAVRKLYLKELGECPYTFADQRGLMDTIARLATDSDFYASEQRRVSEYVTRVHDYPAVAKRYEQILATALGARRAA
jgi:hypothetical protein